ncbi:hypothetical protein ACFQ1I_37150 [Kitasatospora arboriphila]
MLVSCSEVSRSRLARRSVALRSRSSRGTACGTVAATAPPSSSDCQRVRRSIVLRRQIRRATNQPTTGASIISRKYSDQGPSTGGRIANSRARPQAASSASVP